MAEAAKGNFRLIFSEKLKRRVEMLRIIEELQTSDNKEALRWLTVLIGSQKEKATMPELIKLLLPEK